MVGLRPEDQVDLGRTPQDLFALRLGHASRHRDQGPITRALAIGLDALEPPQLRIYLFTRLFADVTGVQDHQIRILGRRCCDIAQGRQNIGHAGRVIDIHLTSVGLDEQFFGHGWILTSGR